MSNALESNQRTARKQEDFVKCRYVVMPEVEQEKNPRIELTIAFYVLRGTLNLRKLN